MDIHTIFIRLNLKKHSDTIYLYLLDQKKPILMSHIAEAIQVARPQVYRAMEGLLEYDFVKKVSMGNRAHYLANPPETITAAFNAVTTSASSHVDTLIKNSTKHLPTNIFFLQGAEGIRKAFDDAVEKTPKGETFFRYTSERELAQVNKYLSPNYRTLRDKKKLERLVISNPISGKQKRSRLERFIKYIPAEADLFAHNIIQLIYADRIAFINLNIESVIIIEDQNLANFQKVIFKLLYKKL